MNYCPYCMNELAEGSTVCPSCGQDTAAYASPPHTLARGAMLNHRYMVGGVLGEGGFGITYIGLDTLLQMRVAIKEFYPSGMVNRNNTVSNEVQSISAAAAQELFSKSRESFLHEARTLAKFANEPGIVSVKDFFEENRTVYIVMEYLDGITLKSYLKQVGTISADNTVCLLMPVFKSLKKIHEKNLIHRDISPDNIMLVGENVKLLDFGAAREFADEKSLSVVLKHGYAPMEQYRRHGKQGAWTDVYAICATVYKCITGAIPPDAPDRVFDDTLKMPSELGFDSSPEFDAFLRHGLAVKAENRIQSIDQLFRELSAVPGFDFDFSDTVTASDELSARKNITGKAASARDSRLSEYVPRGSYDDDEATVIPAKPAFEGGVDAPAQQKEDRRLSAYVPVSEELPEETVPEVQPEEPQTEEKKKKTGKLPLILIASASAAVLIGGIVIAIVMNAGKKPEVSSPQPESSVFTSQAEVSKPDQTSAAETASAPDSAERTTEPQSDESSQNPYMHIIYPELGGNFAVEDGMLTMNQAVFSMQKTSLQLLFGSGTLYVTTEHDRWENGETVMLIPVDLGVYEMDYFDSIDLYFKGDTLYMVQFENGDTFDRSIRDLAAEKFGEPDYEDGETVRWNCKDEGYVYELYMQDYEGEKIFTQRYIGKEMAYEKKLVADGFFG